MSDDRPIVVAGARGFVGRHLVPALLDAGHTVRAGSRHPWQGRLQEHRCTWVPLAVESPETLDAAFEGARALVYLVHQMADGGEGLDDREAAAAEAVADAARRAGLERIVFLGAPVPRHNPSKHLLARQRTGEILRASGVSTLELRAGMIIGPGSESWLIVRDLAARLPLMTLPSWSTTRSQPLWIGDVVHALVHAIDLSAVSSGFYDLPGPEIVTAAQILQRTAHQLGIRTVMVPFPVITPQLSTFWIGLVTRADQTIARQLVHGLTCDLLADGEGFWALAPDLPRTPLDEAIRRALDTEPPVRGVVQRSWERAARRLGRRAIP